MGTSNGWEPSTNARESSFAEFVKFAQVGDSVLGRVVHLDENDSGKFAILSPCVTRNSLGKLGGGAVEMAVGISAGVRNLITKATLGKFIILRLEGFDEKNAKPGQSAMKLYKMWTVTQAEARVRFEMAGPTAVECFDHAIEYAAVDDA